MRSYYGCPFKLEGVFEAQPRIYPVNPYSATTSGASQANY
jgi:hypothetical protein